MKSGAVEHVVLSLGEAGVYLAGGPAPARITAPIVSVRSRVGAGDSMVGGIVHALANGGRMKEAVRFGVACGTAAVMTRGTELCRKYDAEALYERILHGPSSER